MTTDPTAAQPSEVAARLEAIERALADLATYEATLNSGIANGLRAADWDRPPEVAPVAAERAALLAERELLLRRD